MEVTGPARTLPASQVFPRAGEGKSCSPGEGGQEPRPAAAFPSGIWHSRLGVHAHGHWGTSIPLGPRAEYWLQKRWRGWMSPLRAWRGKREQGHLSPASSLSSGASPSTPSLTHIPQAGWGSLLLAPVARGAQSGPLSPRPGSAGCCVSTSVCLRDGLQRGTQPRGLRRG